MAAKRIIQVFPNTYIYMVLLLFVVPIKWLVAWLLAAGFHEFCHWLAVRMLGGEIYRIEIGIGGAVMESSPLTSRRRLIALLSGPVGGFVLVLVGRWLPRIAFCSWFLSVYNLLPLFPLDGGKALEIMLGRKAMFIQRLFLLVLSVGAVYATVVWDIGLLPIVLVVFLWVKNRKRPCKPDVCRVQ